MNATTRLAILAGLCIALPAAAGEITVPGDQPTIQDAIDAAVNGDEIVVSPGTYFENIDLGAKTLVLRSASGDPADTTIDGGGVNRVVFAGFTGFGTRLEGFTITGGNTAAGGGGLLNNGGQIEVANCVFYANNAFVGGGLMNIGRISVINCMFSGNTATGATARGGGTENGAFATFINCVWSGNTAGGVGGGANSGGGSTGVTAYINCSFSENSAADGGGAHVEASASMIDCLFRNNAPDDVYHGATGEVMLLNCFAATINGTGMSASNSTFGTDPLFADPDGADNVIGTPDDDLRLTAGSTAIDTALMRIDCLTDLDGNARVAGDGGDMGAYEFGSAPPSGGGACPGDTNGDGIIGIVDLLFVLSAWGACN